MLNGILQKVMWGNLLEIVESGGIMGQMPGGTRRPNMGEPTGASSTALSLSSSNKPLKLRLVKEQLKVQKRTQTK